MTVWVMDMRGSFGLAPKALADEKKAPETVKSGVLRTGAN